MEKGEIKIGKIVWRISKRRQYSEKELERKKRKWERKR